MKNFIPSIFFYLISTVVFSQQNQLWKGYFSYNSIKDIAQSTTHIYAASENAYFVKNATTNEVSRKSTVEGLSGQTISQIHYSETFKKTLIGHIDGLLIVVNDTDGTMLNVVDIVNKPSVPPNMKKINHFTEYNGKVYIATDFGICVFDLATSQFGDTYFIGPNGANIQIFQTAISNNTIYAVANGYGLLTAPINNPNLIDFNQWAMTAPGNWASVTATSTEIALINLTSGLYKLVANSPVFVSNFNQVSLDARYQSDNFIVTTQNYVYVFDSSLNEIFRVNNTSDPSTSFSCSTMLNGKLYIGTQEKGLLSTTQTNTLVFENNTPNGPDRNKIFSIKTLSKGLWAVYGDYSLFYNPFPLDSYGVSKFDNQIGWQSISYDQLFTARSITRILTHPDNENEAYFSSYHSGLLKITNNTPEVLYNNANSSLQNISGSTVDDIRINGSAADAEGNMWFTNSLVTNGLHVFRRSGQWQGYALTALLNPVLTSFGRLDIDKNGTKWVATNRNGVVGFNEKYNNKSIAISEGSENGNLPSIDVRAVAVDNKNKLWIGTIKGLRVLSNVDSFLNQNELSTNSIIILEDGLAQELLYNQFITDIVVDGANNKWIGTSGAGVFYISDDGQKTFNIFTKENSPLPSNTINDIDINKNTGEVFIATDSGLVSYRGTATSGAEDLENVFVFPNPVRPEFVGDIAVSGLMDKANVKITDIEGNLVHEAIAEGGTVLWNGKAFGKYKVASGVYMVLVSSDDGALTKVKKIMIIR